MTKEKIEDKKKEDNINIPKQSVVKKPVAKKEPPKEEKFKAQDLADQLGIDKYDFFLICKEKNISRDNYITRNELMEVYNKIIRR